MMQTLLHVHPVQASVVAGLVYAVASWDECVSLVDKAGAGTAAVLDQAERELSAFGIRCVRIQAPPSGGLALRDLLAQVVGQVDPTALTDDDLQAGFTTLTEPGEGFSRVALLVGEAHSLLPSAVRYIQFACRSSSKLLVVLAGQPALSAMLAQDEFAYLRQRITRRLELPSPAADIPEQPIPAAAPAAAPTPETLPTRVVRRWNGTGTLVKLGVAAMLALVVLTTRWGDLQTRLTTGTPANAPVPNGRATTLARTEPETPPVQPDALVVWTTPRSDPPAPTAPVPTAPVPTAPVPTAALPTAPAPAASLPIVPAPAAPVAEAPVAEAQPDVPAPASDSQVAGGETQPGAPAVEAAEPAAGQPQQLPTEPAPFPVANAPSSDEPAAVRQEAAEPVRGRVEEAPPLAPEQAIAATGEPLPGPTASLANQPDTPPVVPSGTPGSETVDRAPTAPAESPAPATQGMVPEPAGSVGRDVAPPPETAVAVPTPSTAPPAAPFDPGPVAPPPPPPNRTRTVAASVPAPAEAARRARGTGERAAAPAPPPPVRVTDERRCRDIVVKAQLGEDPSDADKQFLRGGCRVR